MQLAKESVRRVALTQQAMMSRYFADRELIWKEDEFGVYRYYNRIPARPGELSAMSRDPGTGPGQQPM